MLARENESLPVQEEQLEAIACALPEPLHAFSAALGEAQRAGKRQAAPFRKPKQAKKSKKPGRKPGTHYGEHTRRVARKTPRSTQNTKPFSLQNVPTVAPRG